MTPSTVSPNLLHSSHFTVNTFVYFIAIELQLVASRIIQYKPLAPPPIFAFISAMLTTTTEKQSNKICLSNSENYNFFKKGKSGGKHCNELEQMYFGQFQAEVLGCQAVFASLMPFSIFSKHWPVSPLHFWGMQYICMSPANSYI